MVFWIVIEVAIGVVNRFQVFSVLLTKYLPEDFWIGAKTVDSNIRFDRTNNFLGHDLLRISLILALPIANCDVVLGRCRFQIILLNKSEVPTDSARMLLRIIVVLSLRFVLSFVV